MDILSQKLLMMEEPQPKENFTSIIKKEVKQDQDLALNIIDEILSTKCLLVDHMECLETCFVCFQRNICYTNYITVAKALTLCLTSAITSSFLPKKFRICSLFMHTVTTAYCTLYISKNAKRFFNRNYLNKIKKLLKYINAYERIIKKYILYFNELKMLKAITVKNYLRNSHKISIECIYSIKNVTATLFAATRQLEKLVLLSPKYRDLYYPMEDLNDCEYFQRNLTELDTSNIKDFYNIFAYVQSQFLLRLGFSTAEQYKKRIIFKEIINVIDEFEIQLERLQLCLQMSIQLKPSREMLLRSTKFDLSSSKKLLSDTSIKLSSSIIAVAQECQNLDFIIQNILFDDNCLYERRHRLNIAQLDEIIKKINVSFSNCGTELKKLTLIQNKCSNPEIQTEVSNEVIPLVDDNTETAQSKNIINILSEPECDDDFFAYVSDSKSESDSSEKKREDFARALKYELLCLEEGNSKKKFKPVLKQLKHKINPIKQEMLEKEQEVLKAKGIDYSKFEYNLDSDSSSDEISNPEKLQSPTRRKKVDNYEKNREYLAEKLPINFFKFDPPSEPIGQEDIIE